MNSKKLQTILAGILAAAALILFIFIISGASGVKAGPGFFLVRSFHLASLYIPLYLLLCAYALLTEGCHKLLTGLNLSILPFLTLTLLLHVLSGNRDFRISRILILEMGLFLSVPFLFILLTVESALIYKLGDFLFPREKWFPSFPAVLSDSIRKLHNPMGKISQLFRFPSIRKEAGDSADLSEGEPVQRDVFPFPDLPSPLEPMENVDDSEIQALISSVLRPDSPGQFVPLRKSPASGKEKFNPEKTMSISSLMDKAVPPASDPGIDFLLDRESGADQDDTAELEELAEAETKAELKKAAELERAAALETDTELEEAGYISDRMDGLDPWRSSDQAEIQDEEALSIEDKLSPEGETEKLGVQPKGLPPKHRRWQKYKVPVSGLLKEYPDEGFDQIDDDTRRAARALEETLFEFKIDAKVVGISKGPVITMFEIQPAAGVKVSRIVNLQDNLALRLAASRIRIVAPIPGKQAIGIEVPNKKRSIVSFRELVSSGDFAGAEYEIPVILGKDISGGNQVIDLARTPHLLIAGSTGSGKSVCVNSLICSILYQRSPRDIKLMMVDPKIVELKLYNDIPHLLTPVITEPKRALQAIQWCLYEMERRYSLLDSMGVRDIKSYNRRIKERDIATTKLPYIVLVIDEFADLMATSGKEMEGIVARLAAMSRAVGIHLVLATQRPSIDVITGLIKANFPSRIAFMVASKTDSRIIIDMMGAEKLLGKGDMLFTSAWDPFPSRMQGSFLSEDEVERVVSYVKTLGEPEYIDDEIFLEEEDEFSSDGGGESSFSDPLYNKSLEIVMQAGKASASYLQRRLKIGYNRAARLVEEMEIRGIVGPQNGSKPREVVHIPDSIGKRDLTD